MGRSSVTLGHACRSPAEPPQIAENPRFPQLAANHPNPFPMGSEHYTHFKNTIICVFCVVSSVDAWSLDPVQCSVFRGTPAPLSMTDLQQSLPRLQPLKECIENFKPAHSMSRKAVHVNRLSGTVKGAVAAVQSVPDDANEAAIIVCCENNRPGIL